MCEEEEASNDNAVPRSPAAEALRHLADLVAERDRAEALRRDLTDQIRTALRRTHDLGVSWSELANVAGYRNAEAARAQAIRHEDREIDPAAVHPDDSYTVSEAAQRLGVTKQAIYDWIKAGRIEVAVDRPRGRRVYLPSSMPSRDSE